MPSFLVDSSNASTDNKSRATPDSQKLAYHKSKLNMNFTMSSVVAWKFHLVAVYIYASEI